MVDPSAAASEMPVYVVPPEKSRSPGPVGFDERHGTVRAVVDERLRCLVRPTARQAARHPGPNTQPPAMR